MMTITIKINVFKKYVTTRTIFKDIILKRNTVHAYSQGNYIET